jgi:anti-sigma-K factor RskA
MNPKTQELACLYLLDQLDAGERASFESRMLGDPQLAAFVGELESTLSRRVHSLPQAEPPDDLLGRIESRIDRLPADRPLTADRRVMPLPWAHRWGIAALFAVAAGILAVRGIRKGPVSDGKSFAIFVGLDSRRSTSAELPLEQGPPDADARFIQLASMAERFWERPDARPVKSGSAGEGGRGYALFDPSSNQGFIAVQQLPAIETGRHYHLWILNTASGEAREAGVLPVGVSNGGLYFFSVAPLSDPVPGGVDFFVTSEGSGNPALKRPSGEVVLGKKRVF